MWGTSPVSGGVRLAAATLLLAAVSPAARAEIELTVFDVLFPGFTPVDIVSADLNQDGLVDMAVANTEGPFDLSIFIAVGDGGFGQVTRDVDGVPTSLFAARVSYINTCDLPAICPLLDGLTDLVVANGEDDLLLLQNLCDGTSFTEYVGLDPGNPGPWDVAAGADVAIVMNVVAKGAAAPAEDLCALAGADAVSCLTQSRVGDGNGGLPGQDYTETVGTIPVRLATGDFDEDGSDDLAVAHSNGPRDSNKVVILLYDTHVSPGGLCWKGREFQDATCPGNGVNPPDLVGLDQPVALVAAHLDLDTHVDLAVVTAGDDSLHVFAGAGDGTFQAAGTLPVLAHPTDLAVGDLDADGDSDLAVTSAPSRPGPGTVSVFLNAGGVFGPGGSAVVGEDPRALVIAELTGAGLPDIAVANTGSSTVHILENLGPPCPWDLDGDGLVSTTDLLALLALWGTDPGGPPDFDGNGDVGTTDLLKLLASWGPCAPMTGACCLGDGSCVLATTTTCASAGGTYEGDGVPCGAGVCVQPTGGCCFGDGTCFAESQVDCLCLGGTYRGDDVTCTPELCPIATGACCFADGTCTVETQSDCKALEGTYQGDDVACTPGLCPEPFGACCLCNGECAETVPSACENLGGVFQGDGTDCDTAPCIGFGACCFMDGSCSEPVAGFVCGIQGGAYLGNCSSCDDCP